MNKHLFQLSAYCGLECKTCPIHLATIEKDPDEQEKMRLEIAEECFRLYGKKYEPGDISNCDGCKANTGRLFAGCRNCKIRECAIQKEIPNCAHCNNFPCEKLLNLFSLDPEAKTRLEKIHNNIH